VLAQYFNRIKNRATKSSSIGISNSKIRKT